MTRGAVLLGAESAAPVLAAVPELELQAASHERAAAVRTRREPRSVPQTIACDPLPVPPCHLVAWCQNGGARGPSAASRTSPGTNDCGQCAPPSVRVKDPAETSPSRSPSDDGSLGVAGDNASRCRPARRPPILPACDQGEAHRRRARSRRAPRHGQPRAQPGHPRQVSRETSRRVLRAAERLGYVPNTLARGLRTARSLIVGMVVPDITNPLFPPDRPRRRAGADAAGYTLVLTDTDNDRDRERRQVEQLRARGADGFIIATARWDDPLLTSSPPPGSRPSWSTATRPAGPLPYVGWRRPPASGSPSSTWSRLGHRDLHLAGPQNTSTGARALGAFRQATRAHRLGLRRPGAVCVAARPTTRPPARATCAGCSATGALLHRGPGRQRPDRPRRPRVLAEHGIRCPGRRVGRRLQRHAVRGAVPAAVDDGPATAARMGAVAADLLLNELDSEAQHGAPTRTLLGVDLVVRGSTAALPGSPGPAAADAYRSSGGTPTGNSAGPLPAGAP